MTVQPWIALRQHFIFWRIKFKTRVLNQLRRELSRNPNVLQPHFLPNKLSLFPLNLFPKKLQTQQNGQLASSLTGCTREMGVPLPWLIAQLICLTMQKSLMVTMDTSMAIHSHYWIFGWQLLSLKFVRLMEASTYLITKFYSCWSLQAHERELWA